MLTLRIALKYLFSRKSHSVVNLISAVGVVSILVPVAATIFILSLHGGLVRYIEQLYSDFDSQISIVARTGQFFIPDSTTIRMIEQTAGVRAISQTIEQSVLIEYGQAQYIATIRGVDSAFTSVVPIENRITTGQYSLTLGDLNQVAVGQGVAYNLGLNPALKEPLTIYALGKPTPIPLPIPLYTAATALPSAIYAMDEATDSRYIIASLDFTQNLLQKQREITAIDLALVPNTDPQQVVAALERNMPTTLQVITRDQKHSSLFKMMGIERWIIYALLAMITAIASLSLVGATVMMVSEKQVQNEALLQMGLRPQKMRSVFFNLGVIITVIGTLLGLIAGVILALVQQHYGLLAINGTSMLLDAYPVYLTTENCLLTVFSTLLLGIFISFLTTQSLKSALQ